MKSQCQVSSRFVKKYEKKIAKNCKKFFRGICCHKIESEIDFIVFLSFNTLKVQCHTFFFGFFLVKESVQRDLRSQTFSYFVVGSHFYVVKVYLIWLKLSRNLSLLKAYYKICAKSDNSLQQTQKYESTTKYEMVSLNRL